jgi:O-antigen/teichoic acid export membrane protein
LVIITFSLRLTLNIITSIFLAKQLPFWTNLLNTIIKLITAMGILFAMYFIKKDLFTYAMIFSIVPLLVLLFSTMLLFQKKYKPFKPSLKTFEYSKIQDIMELGLKFFIIQLGATMLFMTDNIVISHFLSPAEVTPYQIAFKYFGIVLIIFSIVISPYWSAITDAYAKNDFEWIKKTIKSLNRIWGLCILLTLLLLIVYNPVLDFWIGSKIEISFLLAFQWALFICLQTYNNIYTIFLNGSGKIHLQMITGIITLVINLPLSIFFATYLNLGSAGVLLATNFSILSYVITRKIQYNKLVNKKANGIWAK